MTRSRSPPALPQIANLSIPDVISARALPFTRHLKTFAFRRTGPNPTQLNDNPALFTKRTNVQSDLERERNSIRLFSRNHCFDHGKSEPETAIFHK